MTKTTAKLFMHGRSQAVRLPKKFRMPGKEVEIFRQGDVVSMKPIKKHVKVDWEKFWAEMDALGPADDIYPDGWREQPSLPAEPVEPLD
jgi:antitoxin VapB